MRLIIRVLKYAALLVLGAVLLIFILLVTEGGALPKPDAPDPGEVLAVKTYDPERAGGKLAFLMKAYGHHKTLAKGYELQCLLALSHYPELKEIPIRFLIQPARLQLSARPDPWTLLLPWENRTYQVIISNDTGRENDPILFPKVPFNDQVGILGHELGHILYYLDKKATFFVGLGFDYTFRFAEFAPGFERATDRRAIGHGLGYQLYDFAFFVRKAFGQSLEEIQAERGDLYLSPPEIAGEMAKFDFYKTPLNPPEMYFEK